MKSQGNPADWPSDNPHALAYMIEQDSDGVDEALALAFTPPLAFDPNASIQWCSPTANDFHRDCDNLLELLILKKPRHYETYARALLDAGFAFEGRQHYAVARQLVLHEKDTSLLEKCMRCGLDIHAYCSERVPHNVLFDAVREGRPDRVAWLLGQGVDPYIKYRFVARGDDELTERSLFSEALHYCRNNGKSNASESYISIPMMLFKLGLAKCTDINSQYIHFTDCYGYKPHLFTSEPASHRTGWSSMAESQSSAGSPWERKRFAAFRDYLVQCSNLLVDYAAGNRPVEKMTPEELMQIYNIDGMERLGESGIWHGYERHLYNLFIQMPEPVRREMLECAPDLIGLGEAQLATSRIHTPAKHWAPQILAESPHSQR